MTPRRVLAAQQAIRDEIERQPSRVPAARASRACVGAPHRPADPRCARPPLQSRPSSAPRPTDLVFVDNATTGVNAVLRSMPLAPGDEILLTDHAYGARRERRGVRGARAGRDGAHASTVPYPAFDRGALVDAIDAAIAPATRLAVLDHITSESALVVPDGGDWRPGAARGACRCSSTARTRPACCRSTCRRSASTGTPPTSTSGRARRAAAASCGRRRARQAELHPPVISWGLDKGFAAEFDWVGTRDPSAWLAAPEGSRSSRELGLRRGPRLQPRPGLARRAIARRSLGHDARASTRPTSASWRRSRCRRRWDRRPPMPRASGIALLFDDRIEVQVHAAHGRLWARISAQVYNEWATSNGWPRQSDGSDADGPRVQGSDGHQGPGAAILAATAVSCARAPIAMPPVAAPASTCGFPRWTNTGSR